MNFKKYHVSKNLFDEIYPDISGTLRYKAIYVGDGTFTLSTTTPYDSSVANVFLLSGDVSSGASTANNGAWLNHKVTAQSDNGYVTIAYRHYTGTTSPEACDTMLNKGTEALPYEPYSSEVWHDIPYYQHKPATDTLTLPATLYPNDTSITVGLKGNEEHTGTPSPQNPVVISGTGERTENWFDINSVTLGKWYTNSGTLQSQPYGAISVMQEVTAEEYTIKWYGFKPYSVSYVWFDSNKDFISRTHHGGYDGISDMYTDTVPSNAVYFILQMSNGTDTSNPITIEQLETYQTMLNAGSTALPYEPWGFKIPILLNSTTINKYLGTEQTTRQIKKLVLTGEEDWRYSTPSGGFWISGVPNDYKNNLIGCVTSVCSHYKSIQNDTGFSHMSNNEMCFYSRSSPVTSIRETYIKDSRYTTNTAFKAFLAEQYAAGHPVTVWYVLATATTGTVNEPLMKIGSYSDSLTTSVPCTAGENTLDVQTTVAPSEVTANYQGWHPVQSVHEKSKNLFDGEVEQGTFNPSNGHEGDNNKRVRTTFSSPLVSGTYTIAADGVGDVVVYAYSQNSVSSFDINSSQVTWQSLPYTFNLSETRYVRFAFRKNSSDPVITISDISNIMLNTGETALPYEPYWN